MFFSNFVFFIIVFLVDVKWVLGDSVKNTHFKLCSRSSPNFGLCIKESIMEAKPKFVRGIPEIGFPVLEPLIFRPFDFKENNQQFKISASLTDLYFEGLSNMTVEDVTVSGDIDTEMTINITISGPAFHGSSKWSGKGRALQFYINGGGKIDLNLTDSDYKFTIKGSAEVRKTDGKKYFSVHTVAFDPIMRKAHSYVTGLYPDNRNLNQMANKFINRNMKFIIRLMRSYVGIYISGEFEKLVKIVFDTWPIDELMLD